MLSRVADSVYWLNRYIERAENYARLIDVNLNLMLDLPEGIEEQWSPLIKTTGDDADYVERFGIYEKDQVIQFMVFDNQNPNSVLSCLNMARENARVVREMISTEMWQQINELYLNVKEGLQLKQWDVEKLSSFFKMIKTGAHGFSGVMDATFSHSEAWQFGMLGRFLERADKTARILDMKYFYLLPSATNIGSPLDLLHWSALLKSASAYEMYRKTYGKLDSRHITEFLILNRHFPRAIYYCTLEAHKALHAITGADFMGFSNSAGKALGRLRSELTYTEVDEIIGFGLHQYLDNFQKKTNQVGDAVFDSFFSI